MRFFFAFDSCKGFQMHHTEIAMDDKMIAFHTPKCFSMLSTTTFTSSTSKILTPHQFVSSPSRFCVLPSRHQQSLFSTKVTTVCTNPTMSAAIIAPTIDWTVSSTDLTITGGIFVIVIGWLVLWQQLTVRGVVSSLITRKVIHISCGPAFIFLWPFYSDNFSAKIIASSIPILFAMLLIISGLSSKSESKRAALGRAISRRDDSRDALGGPLYYTIILLGLTLFEFKTPIAAVAIMQLCVGDGMAEVVGRKFGYLCPWPFEWAKHKSVVGSGAFVMFSFFASVGAIMWFQSNQVMDVTMSSQLKYVQLSDWNYMLLCLSATSVGCAAVELAPTSIVGDDNIAIAAVAVFMSSMLLH